MALKITRSIDPIEVKTIVLELHSPPGVGKTSTGFTADAPLCFAFDRGVYRSKFRGDSVIPASWPEVVGVTAADLAAYKTIVLDTVGMGLDLLATHLVETNPKNARKSGGISRDGWQALSGEFAAWLTRLRHMGKDVVLLSHMTEKQEGEEIKERLDIKGATKDEIYKVSDAMGRLYIAEGKRWITFNPTETAFGKNPGQLPVLEVPDFNKTPDFLAQVIAQTKAGINAQTEAQREVQAALETWRQAFEKAETPADFDDLRESIKQDADPRLKAGLGGVMAQAAKAKGIVFDKGADKFVSVEPPKAEEKPAEGKGEAPPPETSGTSTAPAGGAGTEPTKGEAGEPPKPRRGKAKQVELGEARDPGQEG